jgi:hypothetical protein
MPKRKNDDAPYWVTLRKCETDMINYALEQAGSIRKAAKSLGVSESFLITRVKTLGCKRPELPGQSKEDWKNRAKAAEAKTRQKEQVATAKKKKAAAKKKKAAAKKKSATKRANSKKKPAKPATPDNVVPLNPNNGNGAA